MYKLTEKEKDTLLEIANIGSGNAARALEALSGCTIEPRNPELMLLSEKEAGKYFAASKIVYGGVDISGKIKGQAVFIFPEKDANRLTTAVSKKASIPFGKLSESVFKEIFNIFAGSYLSAMAELLKITILHSFPKLVVGQTSGILKEIYINQKGQEVICIKTIINIKAANISGFYMLVIDPGNLKKLLALINKSF